MTAKKPEKTAEQLYEEAEAEEKAEKELKELNAMGNPNDPHKAEKTTADLKRDIEEQTQHDEFKKWEHIRGLSTKKMNEHPEESFTRGERFVSGIKSFAADFNLKKTAPGQSVIRNTLDVLATGNFSTPETRTFSKGISAVKEKMAHERGNPPIYGIHPITSSSSSSSRNYTKKQVMPQQSKKSSTPRPIAKTNPVFQNIGLNKSPLDFSGIGGTQRKGKPPQKKGNPYDLGFRI